MEPAARLSASVPGASFVRRRSVRTASGIASVTALVGLSLLGASPAQAAIVTAADCDQTPVTGNTVNAATQTAADIQNLLDIQTPIICLVGTFTLTSPLVYTADTTIFGLSNAVLDGGGTTGLIEVFSVLSPALSVVDLTLTGGNSFAGGAINGYGVSIIDSTFHDNQAGLLGGAVFANGYLDVSGSTFTDNAADYGGALVAGAPLTVSTSTFTGNDAIDGGAIIGYDTVVVKTSTFLDNTASDGGGALAGGEAEITDSMFDANSAANTGGALLIGDLTVTNSTFVGNSVTDSGGLGGAIRTSTGTVTHATFLNNTAVSPTAGQSLWAGSGPTSGLTLLGNIFADSAGATGSLQIAVDAGVTVDGGGNLFTTPELTEVYFTGTSASIDPSTTFDLTTLALFGGNALALNGGPTRTIALATDSPAIGAVPAGDTTVNDQRGVARHSVSDAGAYEHDDPAAPALAATGSTPGWLGGVAAVLLTLGGAAVLTTRRLRRSL